MSDSRYAAKGGFTPADKRLWLGCMTVGLAWLVAACSGLKSRPEGALSEAVERADRALLEVRGKFAPDPHLTIFAIGLEPRGNSFALTGEVDSVQTKIAALEAVQGTGLHVTDEVRMLPAADLGERTWGLGCLSVAGGREQPAHAAELGTQTLMGDAVRLWKRAPPTNGGPTWFLAQSSDGYLAWLEGGTFVPCTEAQVQTWERGPLLIVTALEDQVFAQPDAGAQPVSDVVAGNRLRHLGATGEWFRVALPDGREGFLAQRSAADFQTWRESRHATPETIEQTARRFLGRPYWWGGCSSKGLDCSGFTKLVFFLNGVALQRNAAQQVQQGVEVTLDAHLSQLKKGDLLFFGRPARGDRPEKIVHTGIYLGDQQFIHSLGRVHISSLDPDSPLGDPTHLRRLRHARRVLPSSP